MSATVVAAATGQGAPSRTLAAVRAEREGLYVPQSPSPAGPEWGVLPMELPIGISP
jgi:hypothetical protein